MIKTTQIRFETLLPELIPAAAAIESESFQDPWSEETLTEEIKNDTIRFLTAFYQEKIVGYCCAQIVCGEAELLRIAVRKEDRNAGVGRCILREIKRRLKEEAAKVLFLEVRETNHPAKQLYQTEGFQEIFIRKNYYGNENAIVMRCIL
ncbi:MAG: ribosomal protein S18-alanine N-acetyltransferase [Clostridiales bacterium]|nr:ribosomal protein S18-alanine N-acetyltransferase [Clostridiales bacterium]